MRRILFLIAAALSATLVHAQDAENVGNSAQLSIIPRIDLNPYIGFDSQTDFSLSNSSLYTLFEGDLGEHFSFSIANHWLSSEPASLYKGTFCSNVNSWCDWANVTGYFGDFGITLGKNYMLIGTYEEDAYDYESHWDLNSTFWNCMPVYQWGGDFSWYYDDEAQLSLQLTSSPFSEHPFDDGLFTVNAYNTNVFGDFSYLASLNFIGYTNNSFLKMASASFQYAMGDFTLTPEFMYRWSDIPDSAESTFVTSLEYTPSDKVSLILKAGYEGAPEMSPFMLSEPDNFFGGAALHYYPLKDSDALRCHCVVSYSPVWNGLSINIGALYNISLNIK